ncbi:class I SAM-dependent methyltransferase [Kamptonema cortianum]|nr:class I SAM-dependent methyltransferase [Geitlerinema splendidum]MDK3158749.1 class I SAM-dependent methyltransferase [Kamptonema cortianum]
MKLEKPTARDQFSKVAENYLTSKAHDRPEALAHLVRLVDRPGGTIVDVGTGAGLTAYAFAPFVDEVIAVDLTPEMLEIVEREAVQRGHHNISTKLADAERMPFSPESVDGVVTRMAAHHFTDVEKFVSECARILKPGGWFAIVDTVGTEDEETTKAIDRIETLRDPSHMHDLRPSEWRELVESAGFRVRSADVYPKDIDLEDWFTRMKVGDEIASGLRRDILESTGLLRDYLNPVVIQGRWVFHLHEMTLIVDKMRSSA